jgi:hypothetical protein
MNDSPPPQDPWVAFSRVAGGVIFYGGAGFLLDLWWDTSFMVAIGVVVGAALGIYTVAMAQRDH